jgi:type II secretory pathway pseudopilin PulG
VPTCPSCGYEGPGSYCANCGVAYAAGGPKKGLSGCAIAGIVAGAVGCVSLPIIGIIASIAIPNLLNAIDRGKQKRTMGDMRTVAVAVEAYAVDHNRYPESPDWANVDVLVPYLEPTYVRSLPPLDGWMNPVQYHSDGTTYTLWSTGRDGMVDDPEPSGPTQLFDNDIIWQDGKFVAWPEGSQSGSRGRSGTRGSSRRP